jgi:MarR family transcriptional regulator, 2-MHQ and catechol-resistance regulon repressor
VNEREAGAPSLMVLWLAIVRTRPTLDRLGRWILGHLGLSLTDFKILESVLHEGPLTPSRLGHEIGLTRGSVTSAVDRLAARGLVGREPNAADARSSLVKLTPAGTKVIEEAWRFHTAEVERVMEGTLSSDEMAVLLKLLGRVRRTVRKECGRLEAP